MANRRRAREALLRAMYLAESRDITVARAFREMADIDILAAEIDTPEAKEELRPFTLGLDKEEKTFALRLADEIERNRDDWNTHIAAVLKNWHFSRISRIDRIILWMALAEMSCMLDIPVGVSMNEAIELARAYSSDNSPKFINGVLEAAAKHLGFIAKGPERKTDGNVE